MLCGHGLQIRAIELLTYPSYRGLPCKAGVCGYSSYNMHIFPVLCVFGSIAMRL